MQESVRQELRDLGITNEEIAAWEQRSAGVSEYMQRGGVEWSKDERTKEIIFHWASHDDCHEIYVPCESRYPAHDYVSDWQLRHGERLTQRQRDRLGPAPLSAARQNSRGELMITKWWSRSQVDAARAPRPQQPPQPPAQGSLF